VHLSDAEWKVMSVVWDHNAVGAREVLDALEPDTGWAYTTVKTMLARLTEKGALSEHKEGNRSVYQPRLSREDARRSAVRSLLDKAFDGAFGSLFHYLVDDGKLSKRDRAQLEAVLRQRGKAR